MPRVWIVALREYRAAVQTRTFILSLVLMPDEFTFDLRQLEMEIVDRAADSGVPVVVEQAEFFVQIGFLNHLATPVWNSQKGCSPIIGYCNFGEIRKSDEFPAAR